MKTIEKSTEVAQPLTVVYNQWTQFEDFPEFMAGVKEVRQLDSRILYWRAEVGGKIEEWTAEIFDQVADDHIAWRSLTGAKNSGVVRFEEIEHAAIVAENALDEELGLLAKRLPEIVVEVGKQPQVGRDRFEIA